MFENPKPDSTAFPYLPDDLYIGTIKKVVRKNAIFKGEVHPEINILEIPSGSMRVCLCERGIRLENIFHKHKIEIHKSQVISCDLETVGVGSQQNQPVLLKSLFKILALLTLGTFVGDLSENQQKRYKDIPCLAIHFWNPSTHAAEKIFVSGRRKHIKSFLSVYTEFHSPP